jgi:hypothetical protein
VDGALKRHLQDAHAHPGLERLGGWADCGRVQHVPREDRIGVRGVLDEVGPFGASYCQWVRYWFPIIWEGVQLVGDEGIREAVERRVALDVPADMLNKRFFLRRINLPALVRHSNTLDHA